MTNINNNLFLRQSQIQKQAQVNNEQKQKENETQEQVNEQNFAHVRAMLQALKISAVFHPSIEFISSLGTILVVGFGGYLAYREGLSVADIVAFLLYLGLFYGLSW